MTAPSSANTSFPTHPHSFLGMALAPTTLTAAQEARMIATLNNVSLTAGASWYVISSRWWQLWCDYTGYKAESVAASSSWDVDIENVTDSPSNAAAGTGLAPGPIDNSELAGPFKIDLKAGLVEGLDFVLVHEDAHTMLNQWYGGGPSFKRTVISVGLALNADVRVELYPCCIPVALADPVTGEPLLGESIEYKLISREKSTLQSIVDLYETKRTPSSDTYVGRSTVRLWVPEFSKLELVNLTELARPLDELQLSADDVVCVERLKEDNTWPRASFERVFGDFKVNDDLDAKDYLMEKWFECSVLKVEAGTDGQQKIRVHFKGFESKWDAWYDFGVASQRARLARCSTHTDGAMIPKELRPTATAVTATAVTTTAVSDEDEPGTLNFSNWSTSKSSSSSSNYGHSLGSYTSSWNSHEAGTTPVNGATGLRNLGNTCFMNSTIQCLSNTPLLTNYFLSGLYKDQINRDNPLGWQGKIAEEWGKLLEDMWNGKYRVVAPRELKTAIGEFQPRFSGYQQQDSSELLSFLLDGLHEDLNRVLKKPATQPVEFDGRPLDELAKAAWQTHLMRNQSVIVDTCQGQLMSKLVCPKCARVSITFDPFMFFSVPLPTVKDKVVTITFQSADLSAAPIVYGVSVPKLGIMADVKRSLSSMIGVSTRRMVCVDMHQGRVYRMLAEDFGISEVRHSDDIWIHEVPGLEEQDAKVASQRSVPIVVSGIIAKPNPLYTAGSIFHKEFKYESVGRPSMIMLPQSNNVVSLTNAELHRHIKQCVQHWIAPSDDTESKPYTVVLSDRNGSSCGKCSYMSRCNGCELPDDDEPCDLSLDLALNICWTSADRCIPPVEPTRDSSAPSESKAASSYSFGQSEQRSTCSLADCFRAFSEEETLGENDAWYCNKCKDHVLATKKMDVWRAPDVLIIHLKRFQYTRLWREKLDTLVDFPFEGLDMGPWLGSAENKQDAIYDLYAISNHMGGLGGGHYTAYAKNLHNQQWYDFNDSSVTPVRDIEEMKSSSAYVLFYARRGALTSHL